jgi:rhodanese-related sulfurtransferase
LHIKKRLSAILLAVAVSIVAASCSSAPAAASTMQSTAPAAVYRKISAEEAHAMMQKDKGFILLDVRTQDEFNQGHISGAVLLPDTLIAEKAATALPDKNAEILVYCRSGHRSSGAAKALVAMGYVNVYDFGGIIDWPYATVK